MSQRPWYRANEFAKLTGVTIRTLHHYDRLGLLTPVGRTAAGYRLYGEGDFARLQQIVTLKFIGFSLKQIQEILNRGTEDLATRLRQQREILEQKRHHLTLAVQAIAKAEEVIASDVEADWQTFQKIIEVINMQNDNEWMMNYYSEEARQEMQERPDQWTPELQEKVSQEWTTLIRDVEAAIAKNEDPASESVQTLATRWSELVGRFTLGSPAITEGLNKLYADQANWPSTFEKPYSDEVGAFICRAQAIGKGEAKT